MKRKWQLVDPGKQAGGSRWNYLYATINPKGDIAFSRRTFEKLGEPERVLVMYDAESNTIGVQPARPRQPGTFYLARHGRNGNARKIHALTLLRDHNITITHTLRFTNPTLDDENILILDLTQTRPAKKGQNGRARNS